MIPCLFDPKQHQIIGGGEILSFCKREAPANERPRLFLYRHKLLGTFVIARWASDQALGVFTDFLHIGRSLDEFTKEKAIEFRKRYYAPLQATKIADTINQAARDYKSERQDEADEAQEAVERGMKGR